MGRILDVRGAGCGRTALQGPLAPKTPQGRPRIPAKEIFRAANPFADPGRLDGKQDTNGETPMKRTLVRYKAKPEEASTNQQLIEKVFAELREKSPEGVRYVALRLGDGTFVHFATTEDGALPIPRLDAFAAFQANIKERCLEPPQASDVTIVGNYRMLQE
jgi:hypothetical protein